MAKGKLSVTNTSQPFGPDLAAGKQQKEFIWQNGGSTRCYIVPNGETAVADEGFFLDPGREITSKELPVNFKLGRPSAVTAAGTTELYWHYV